MKKHFLKLLAYDKFENEAISACILEAGAPAFPEKLMAHILSAQQIWLDRCSHTPPASPRNLWPEWKADTFNAIIQDNYNQWKAFIDRLDNDDFEKIIHYTNSTGASFEGSLTDIITHVINHGTHHRAQAGQHLKLAGIEKLPNTDYITFLRSGLLR